MIIYFIYFLIIPVTALLLSIMIKIFKNTANWGKSPFPSPVKTPVFIRIISTEYFIYLYLYVFLGIKPTVSLLYIKCIVIISRLSRVQLCEPRVTTVINIYNMSFTCCNSSILIKTYNSYFSCFV